MSKAIWLKEANMYINISKVREGRLISGWASVAKNADGSFAFDWEGDILTPEVLEKAALNFMEDSRQSGLQHKGESVATVVESIVFTKEKMAAMGIPEGVVPEGWFVTVKVSEEVFEKVKSGQYKMFSIQGKAKRLNL